MAEILNKPFAIQQGPDAEKIDYNFDVLFRRLRNLEGAHNILSVTHEDTTPATLVDGDILIVSGGKLTRLPIGSASRFLKVVSSLPAWAALAASDLPAHNLLGTQHGDTTAASPQLGDVITADQEQQVQAYNDSQYWIDGDEIAFIYTGADNANEQFWLDGESAESLIPTVGVGAVTWRRKAKGTEGAFLRIVSGKPEWTTEGGTGDGARVYRSSDFTLTWGVSTAMTFDSIEQDDIGYFNLGSPTRFTVAASGWYLAHGQVAADYAQFGLFELRIKVSGTDKAGVQLGIDNVSSGWGVDTERKQVTTLVYLQAGDYVELYCTAARTSGANANMKGGAAKTYFSILKVG